MKLRLVLNYEPKADLELFPIPPVSAPQVLGLQPCTLHVPCICSYYTTYIGQTCVPNLTWHLVISLALFFLRDRVMGSGGAAGGFSRGRS